MPQGTWIDFKSLRAQLDFRRVLEHYGGLTRRVSLHSERAGSHLANYPSPAHGQLSGRIGENCEGIEDSRRSALFGGNSILPRPTSAWALRPKLLLVATLRAASFASLHRCEKVMP